MNLWLPALALLLSIRANALINGSPLNGDGDLVRLVFKNGWVCSGAYVDPFTILTAGHCVSGLTDAKDLKQILTENDGLLDVFPVALVTHPDFDHQFWPSHDLGIIKTTENRNYQGTFKLADHIKNRRGGAILFGCGRISVDQRSYSRTTGENDFVAIGSVLLFVGKSSQSSPSGFSVTIAPNDSGAPVTDKSTGMIIGVASQTTAKTSNDYGLPAISLATATVSADNLEFIRVHLGMTTLNPGR